MATITAFIRTSSKDTLANIRFRIRDGRSVQIFYKGSKKINAELFDSKKEQIKARALINNALRLEINNYILKTKEKLNVIYNSRHPKTSEELSFLMDNKQTNVLNSILDLFDKKLQGTDKGSTSYRTFMLAKHKMEIYSENTGFVWNIDTINSQDLQNYEEYLYNTGASKNYVVTLLKRLKSVCSYALKYGYTTNNPFLNYSIIQPVYGTPNYLTIEERNKIYNTDLSDKPYLAVQRDIFIFQCHIGCRVSNLLEMAKSNVIGDFIEYIPIKTANVKATVIRVPLTDTAKEIIKRYKNIKGAKLLPFISSQKYNDAIKDILEACEINRVVTILDPKTRKEKQVPICDIASSHLARRTFIGNLYKKIKDPNLIGSMSGHSQGSRAFERYRTIDDDIKRETINLIE